MTLSEFTSELKEVVGVTEPKTISELTEEVYKLASLPKELKEIVSDTSTSFTVPNTVPDLRPYVFAGCTVLQNVTLPENTTSIPEAAFLDCVGLSKVQVAGSGSTGTSTYSLDIPLSVTSISKQAFKNTSSLTGVLSIPRHIAEIDDEAFSGSGFSEIQIPSSVGRIGVEAFANCPNLSKVTFVDDFCSYNTPSGPASWDMAYDKLYLDSRVFANTPKLTCITMPDETYNRLSSTAFEDSSLTSVYFRRMPLPNESAGGSCGATATVLYDIWFVRDPCKEEILPCYYTYKLEESNKRWVCEKDGEPCENCTNNVEIADYTIQIKIFRYNEKPSDGWTDLPEHSSYACYYPTNGAQSLGYTVTYDSYARIADGYPFVNNFMRDTVYSDGTPGSETYDTVEIDMVSEYCRAATQHYIYALPETRCLVHVITGDTSNSGSLLEYDMVLTPDKKITASSLCTCTDVECAYTVESTGLTTPCVIKTNAPRPIPAYVNILDENKLVAFTGVPVDLGPFTVITKVDQTA